MRGLRIAAVALAVAVAATACGGDDLPGVVETPPPGEDPTGQPPPGAAPTTPGDGATPGESPPPTAPATDTATDAPTDAPPATTPPAAAPRTVVDDGGGVGANGPAILREDVPRLVIEIDTQEGVGPDRAAVDHLVSVLRDHAHKPDGITFAGGNTFSSDRGQWSPDDIRAVAAANRSTASGDGTVSVQLVYLRGESTSERGEGRAIGVAVNASQVGLFPEQWSGLGALVGSSSAAERAVLVHEIGHLLGLVNLTYQSDVDHEDPEHPGHSDNRESVMYWAVETDLIGQVFSGPPPDTFDDADIADIEKIRTVSG